MKARFDKDPEIPLAYRTVTPGRYRFDRFRLIVISSVFISISVTVLLLGFISPTSITQKNSIDGSSSNNEKEQLLGHFKYPEIDQSQLVELYPGFKLQKDTFKALMEMRDAALIEGVELVFLSGFRSIKLQEQIFYENKSARNQIALERARVSAPPGYSEHSTGFAVDIGDRNYRETDFEPSFEQTPAFKWLKKNAARYHFVMSFPRNNHQNVSYEPWHWRYEGTVEALKQFEPTNRVRMFIK